MPPEVSRPTSGTSAQSYTAFVFATLRFDGVHSRMHAMTRALARLGMDAVYVEPPNSVSRYHQNAGAPTLNAGGFGFRVPAEPGRAADGTRVLCVPKKLALGPMRLPLGRRLQEALQGRWLQQCLAGHAARAAHPTLAIVTTARWEPLLRRFPFDAVIYDKVDAPEILKGWLDPAEYQRREDAVLARSTLALAVSSPLEAALHARRPDLPTLLVPNGVEAPRFRGCAAGRPPAFPRPLRRPVLGFLGTLAHWVDVELLAACAQAYPDSTLVVAGPLRKRADLTPLHALPNVQLLGEVAYADVPALMHHFDVGLLPFRRGAFSGFANPITLFEYLALGKPVVTTPLPDLDALNDLIYVAQEDFIASIQRALAEDTPTLQDRRRAIAAAYDWDVLMRHIVDRLPPPGSHPLPPGGG